MPILDDATESLKGGIGARPSKKGRCDRSDDVVECWEVLIVKAPSADEFPHPLDRIEYRAVGRQEMQSEVAGNFSTPSCVDGCVMIPGIVDDHDRTPTAFATEAFQFSQEVPTGLRVEHSLGSGHHEFPVPQTYCAEETDGFARGCVLADGVTHFRRNPHAASRTMLLKVHLIHGPEVDFGVSSQLAEFFYAPLEVQGRLAPLRAEVFAVETQAAETASGTAEPLASPPAACPRMPRASARPTSSSTSQTPSDSHAARPQLSPIAFHPDDSVCPSALLRTNPQVLVIRNAAPSSQPYAVSLQASQLHADRSCLAQRATLHAADGRNAKHRFAEFHPEVPLPYFHDQISSVVSSPPSMNTVFDIGNYL